MKTLVCVSINKNVKYLFIGTCGQANNPPLQIEGLKCFNIFKALGIHFSKCTAEAVEKNCIDKLRSIHTQLDLWLQRSLSLKGKIVVLKSLIMPKLLFACSNTHVTDNFVKQVQDLTFKFLWGYKPAKIKKDTIIADIQEGGLKMPLFSAVLESTRVMWVKRILKAKDTKWARLAVSLMNTHEFDLYCKNESSYASNALTPFYQQVLKVWYKFHSKEPKQNDEIQQEILWNNQFILRNNCPYIMTKWKESGILYVQDLLDANGEILSMDVNDTT
jgi:regulator of sigma D